MEKIPIQKTMSNFSKDLASDFSFKVITKNLHKKRQKKIIIKSKSNNHCAKTGIRVYRFDRMIFTMTTTLTKRNFPVPYFQIRCDQVPYINWFSLPLFSARSFWFLLVCALITETDFFLCFLTSCRVASMYRNMFGTLIIDDGVVHNHSGKYYVYRSRTGIFFMCTFVYNMTILRYT